MDLDHRVREDLQDQLVPKVPLELQVEGDHPVGVDPLETLDFQDLLEQLDFLVDLVLSVRLVRLVLKVSRVLPVILECQVLPGHLD